jgi:hypothetical protein
MTGIGGRVKEWPEQFGDAARIHFTFGLKHNEWW